MTDARLIDASAPPEQLADASAPPAQVADAVAAHVLAETRCRAAARTGRQPE
ncbi:hypothetical protein ACWIGG_27480 [Micromonospora aurantiaca (nom. illeg.)]|uniref:hypothetical protein n=1 Tax=Micromonospora aurantiaca (nom. illeg.) TaxID=47850 RepID=UPI0036645E0D